MSRKPIVVCALVVAALTAALPLVASAQSNTIWCAGTVRNLWIDQSGNAFVFTSWRNDYVRICNVQESAGVVTATTCLSWVALLKSAVQRSATTTIYYTGTGVPATCPQMTTYASAPIPFYVMLQN